MSRESDELGKIQHLEQFAPDFSSEPDMMTEEELHAINMNLDEAYEKPIDWDKGLDG